MSLLGMWVVDRADARTLAELGDVLLEFHEDGRLTYTIRCATKEQTILMQYRVEGNIIVTDQPSAPQENRDSHLFLEHGRLDDEAERSLSLEAGSWTAFARRWNIAKGDRPTLRAARRPKAKIARAREG